MLNSTHSLGKSHKHKNISRQSQTQLPKVYRSRNKPHFHHKRWETSSYTRMYVARQHSYTQNAQYTATAKQSSIQLATFTDSHRQYIARAKPSYIQSTTVIDSDREYTATAKPSSIQSATVIDSHRQYTVTAKLTSIQLATVTDSHR